MSPADDTTTGKERKLALITGATGGIGRSTAIAFAKTGEYDLALHYNSASQEKRDELSSGIKQSVPSNHFIAFCFFRADLANYDSVRNLRSEIVKQLGNPSILFNNAGATSGLSGVQSLTDVPIDIFEQTWRLNTGASILLT